MAAVEFNTSEYPCPNCHADIVANDCFLTAALRLNPTIQSMIPNQRLDQLCPHCEHTHTITKAYSCSISYTIEYDYLGEIIDPPRLFSDWHLTGLDNLMCPYCKHQFDFDDDDDKADDLSSVNVCPACDKQFIYKVTWIRSVNVEKAYCLDNHAHQWITTAQTDNYSIRRCLTCLTEETVLNNGN
jgi:uncharacterized protein YbaR (Trm112 family)